MITLLSNEGWSVVCPDGVESAAGGLPGPAKERCLGRRKLDGAVTVRRRVTDPGLHKRQQVAGEVLMMMTSRAIDGEWRTRQRAQAAALEAGGSNRAAAGGPRARVRTSCAVGAPLRATAAGLLYISRVRRLG